MFRNFMKKSYRVDRHNKCYLYRRYVIPIILLLCLVTCSAKWYSVVLKTTKHKINYLEFYLVYCTVGVKRVKSIHKHLRDPCSLQQNYYLLDVWKHGVWSQKCCCIRAKEPNWSLSIFNILTYDCFFLFLFILKISQLKKIR